MILDEMAAYLVAQTTGFAVGTNVFKAHMPATSPATAVTLYESGGVAPNGTLSTQTPAFEQPTVQVLSRSTTYVTARDNAQRVWNTFEGVVATSMSGVNYVSVSAIQSPFPIGQDENGNWLISCNFAVRKEVS